LHSKIILMSATINIENFKNYFSLENNAILHINHNLNIRTFF
jgi:HrpA-like RNA helicase